LKPDGTNGGFGLPESSDFFEKTIARITPTIIRSTRMIPIMIFLFFLPEPGS
jgi:hypothetical protein